MKQKLEPPPTSKIRVQPGYSPRPIVITIPEDQEFKILTGPELTMTYLTAPEAGPATVPLDSDDAPSPKPSPPSP